MKQPACSQDTSVSDGTPAFRCVAIVGVGLIGGSLAMALRSRRLAEGILGVDVSPEVLEQARALGAIDTGAMELPALAAADCVVFTSPVGALPELMQSAAPYIRADALVSDAGSLKRRIVEAGEALFGEQFVGGHPMAGSEESGIGAARASLFEGAPWIVSSSRVGRNEPHAAAERFADLVRALGARPIAVSPDRHDHLVSLVSHLPHAVSFAFARALGLAPEGEQAVQIAGASYRDLIRVSRSSPDLWADIFIENRDELLPAMAAFEDSLRLLRDAVESGDRETIRKRLRP